MTRATAEAVLDEDSVEEILRPRCGLIAEAAAGDGRFEQTEGAAHSYRRTVTVEHLTDGRARVRQEVEFHLGLPYFSWLFVVPLRLAVRGLRPDLRSPWWAPPQRLDRRAAVVLATLAALAVVVGYLGTLLSLTMTYAGREFGIGKSGQGVALGVVRINVLLALGLLVLADRHGRRTLLLGALAAGSVLTAAGAVAPSIVWLTAGQVVAVALVAAGLVLIGVMAAEEMPAGSRAWAVAVLTLSIGLGGGLATMALPLADLGLRGWRWLFAGGLLALPVVASATRHLPESRRFEAPGHGGRRRSAGDQAAARSDHHSRLALLGAGSFLYAFFATPSSQFHNEFLRTERAFSATKISAFSLITGTIGSLGVMVGGRLADVRGRRQVAAVGVGAGIVTTVAAYASHGWGMWAWGIADNLLGYGVAPAIAVYGPELFPTALRSRATGTIGILYAAGGVAGLVATGFLSSALGSLAAAFAVLAVGPAAMVVLILVAYPETAGRVLEDLNPEDAAG
ncbi:MAG TPA: MFS transporter [Acidimicrobiales bacterium]|nr:MFS transporter [Acidimicrobiales bacterium]